MTLRPLPDLRFFYEQGAAKLGLSSHQGNFEAMCTMGRARHVDASRTDAAMVSRVDAQNDAAKISRRLMRLPAHLRAVLAAVYDHTPSLGSDQADRYWTSAGLPLRGVLLMLPAPPTRAPDGRPCWSAAEGPHACPDEAFRPPYAVWREPSPPEVCQLPQEVTLAALPCPEAPGPTRRPCTLPRPRSRGRLTRQEAEHLAFVISVGRATRADITEAGRLRASAEALIREAHRRYEQEAGRGRAVDAPESGEALAAREGPGE